MNERGLKINVDKCAVSVFGTRHSEHQLSYIRLAGQEIERVQKWKYLGVILPENISIVPDVDSGGHFMREFNVVYSRFCYMSTEVLCFSLCTCTASCYDAETWYSA